jgi:NAD+ diphosphatase
LSDASREALWFLYKDDLLLVRRDENDFVPSANDPEEFGVETLFRQEIGRLDGRGCWAAELPPDTESPEGFEFRGLRSLFSGMSEDFFRMAGRAKQIVNWNATHRFCGRCGGKTEAVAEELAKKCARCGLLHYPRLSPAIIVLVRDGNRMLLARSPGFPEGMYSVLAGFVEPGESIEETIRREVLEEVGIEVENPRYFGSQPWPFPNSLMIGFTADYAGGELEIDRNEIEDAGWYDPARQELPPLPPKVSIARAMIEDFLSRHAEGRDAPRDLVG